MAQLKLFGSARGGARVAKRGKKEKPARQKKPLKALAIVLTAFSVNLLGDGLRDAMDPRLKN